VTLAESPSGKDQLADISLLQKKLGLKFNTTTLLELALTHSSYINENPGISSSSNERLEFLGDAILGLVMAEKLYQEYPEYDEGELTRLRSALVRKEMLARIAATVELGEYLYLSKGEEAGGGRSKQANLAGAFEALIAAIYLDRGLKTAKNLILNLFGAEMQQQAHLGAETDYKSKLQEVIQAQRQVTPSYHLIKAVGPDHDKQFTVEVRVGEYPLGRGTGKSKKAAEMEAAKEALENL
jgi:ribonuclease III